MPHGSLRVEDMEPFVICELRTKGDGVHETDPFIITEQPKKVNGNERTFERFMVAVEYLLNGTASSKGYSGNGPDGPNELYEFVQHMSNGHQHALGEIVYKARRYAAKGNIEDVAKIAAWSYLIWKHQP